MLRPQHFLVTIDRWHLDPDDLHTVITWLRETVAVSPPGSWHRFAALGDVLCTHVENGFVHLTFLDWPLPAARGVADQLLHPNALLVSDPGPGFMGTSAPAFEGFGWDGEPPEAVLARYSPRPPLRPIARALPTPKAAPPAGVDWGQSPLS